MVLLLPRSRRRAGFQLLHGLGLLAVAFAHGEPPAGSQPASSRKLEAFVMLPEPKAMRSELSQALAGAQKTVLSPARETADTAGVRAYTKSEFAILGISVDSFTQKARAAADQRLATLQPDLVKDASGKVIYAVYRGESPLMASLLIAPSLGRIFEKVLGKEIWAALPDRNSLYLFPADAGMVAEFTSDLQERYESNPFAASCELFAIQRDGGLPKVVGSFSE